jgi:hypothetical protein
MVCSRRIQAVPWNRKLSEFCCEPFHGRGNILEFVPWNKNKLRNFVLKHFAEENTLSILFAETGNFRLNRFLKTWQPPKIKKTASKKTTVYF